MCFGISELIAIPMSVSFLEVLILEAFRYPCLKEREGAFLGLDVSSFCCYIPNSSSLLQVFPQLGSTGLAGVHCRQAALE